MKPTFFATRRELRAWLDEHHDTATELWVGLYKKGSGRPSVTWSEVVDEALCFGWIDGIRRGIDDQSYMNRITPRKPNSNWSEVNIRRVQELTAHTFRGSEGIPRAAEGPGLGPDVRAAVHGEARCRIRAAVPE
jgi:uncharacterized protein YdeI (YjbR/CyaY-like superfamily)